jgi:hypothetical protein
MGIRVLFKQDGQLKELNMIDYKKLIKKKKDIELKKYVKDIKSLNKEQFQVLIGTYLKSLNN